jgi:hypothetical protein
MESENLSNTPEVALAPSAFRDTREKRMRDLLAIGDAADTKQYEIDLVAHADTLMPKNLLRDELASPVIERRAMMDTDRIYEKAKYALGRELTSQEEETLVTTLDYVLKRMINLELHKKVAVDPQRPKQPLLNGIHIGASSLPGDDDLIAYHDLVHIVLSVQQGLLNDNSPVPTFMQAEQGFNISGQSMLEEAFATLYSAGNGTTYDNYVQHPASLVEDAETIFNVKTQPLFRGLEVGSRPIFSTQKYVEEAKQVIVSFIDRNAGKLDSSNLLTALALFSQGASLAELFGSDYIRTLTEPERLAFIKERIQYAQENIDAIITGSVSEGKDEKYRKTLEITRQSYHDAVDQEHKNPGKPVFVEKLLGTLSPLYAKAKAQQEASFARLASKKYDLPTA